MRQLASLTCACAATVVGMPPAQAATYAVDDSASHIEAQSPMRLSGTGPGLSGGSGMDSTLRVNTVLDLRPWVGRSGRIYMALPPQPLASLRLQWRTQGRLLAGQLTGGQRALVYEGPITAALLQDRLDITVRVDGRELQMPQRLSLSFEIDLP